LLRRVCGPYDGFATTGTASVIALTNNGGTHGGAVAAPSMSKNSCPVAHVARRAHHQNSKVFCFFSSEKKTLP
jgi:hypothetical protein